MKTFIRTIVCLAAFAAGTTSYSQVTQEWVRTYSGPGSNIDIAFSLVADNLGNVYVTGDSPGKTSANDITTVKYNAAGEQQWASRYNGPGNGDDGTNGTNAIAVDSSGDVYVAGWSQGLGSFDFVTIKYNSAGVEQWARRYDGPGNAYDAPYGVAIDGSGNVYVAGGSAQGGTGDDYTAIKYNASGVEQWVRTYNGPGNGYDVAQSFTVDASGNLYLTGFSTGASGLSDCTTIKYSTTGVQQWVEIYNGPANGNDSGNSVAVDGSGNVYVTGVSTGSGTGRDYLTIKYNSEGEQQWAPTYSSVGSAWDEARSVGVDNAGNVYVTGALEYSEGKDSTDNFGTLKYDSSGQLQWHKTYDGPAQSADEAFSIAVDAIGNSYVVGRAAGLTSGLDLTTVKYNTAGVEQWVRAYNGPENNTDVGFDVGLDSQGNVIVSGATTGATTFLDYAIVKYSPNVPVPKSAVSRKTHAAAGSFDIPLPQLPIGGAIGIEPRNGPGAGEHQVVVTFANPVTVDGASVTTGTGSATFSVVDAVVTINLSGVANAQRLAITLANVNDGTDVGDVIIPMGILSGDTGGDGTVSASDISQTKAQSGQPVTGANFRQDVNADGSISASDISLVKSNSGTAL